MKSVAIIGTGIAAMAAAHRLHRHFTLTLYEKNDYVGGHTHTVDVPEGASQIPIDTGFIVYNEVNYPELTKLFAALGVPTMETDMSFSVQHEPSGLEFCGSGWNGLFARRSNVWNLSYWRLLKDIERFNRESVSILSDSRFADMTLEAYVADQGYSQDLLDRYLVPMSSAVWSTPPESMLGFPAIMLVRFFKNHGFLGLYTQHRWRTVVGGSRQYRERLIAPFRQRIQTQCAALALERHPHRVTVHDARGQAHRYDYAVVATHADEAMALLRQPTDRERLLLSVFHYQANRVTLHTDAAVMPRCRRAWSSWNYWTGRSPEGKSVSSTIYWMNRLQRVSEKKNYFISINDPGRVRPEHRLREFSYTHPLFTSATQSAQPQLGSLNHEGPVVFAGSYFRSGFHEDALISGYAAAEALLERPR